LSDFSQTIEKYFSAKSQQLDFINGNAEAIKIINEDISCATSGKIPTLLKSIDKNARIILANVIYFKVENVNLKIFQQFL
jgi:serine protease inhibitor